MGNHLSCTAARLLPAVKVLNTVDGLVSEFPDSITAAELMLEHPNHFVIHSSALASPKRISALSADEELKVAHLYILLPMQKLHTRLSSEEITLFTAFSSHHQKGKPSKYGQSKVAPLDPETSGIPAVPFRSVSFQYNSSQENAIAGSQRLLAKARSWVPKLETISEMSLLTAR